MSTELELLLAERISADGPMTFAGFMEAALYHPQFGYYTRGPERSGWAGHFITSSQLDPAFAELWGRWFHRIWVTAGEPDRFDIIEAGPGEGGFATALLDHLPNDGFAAAVRLTLIEQAPALRQRQKETLRGRTHDVRWCENLSAVPPTGSGCFFANEVLDNQPVHLVEKRNGETLELFVSLTAGSLSLEAASPSDRVARFLERHPAELPEGRRVELSPAAEAFILEAASKIERGAVVFVDYGAETVDLTTKPGGSLVCYSERGADLDPLERPGEKDLTVFADWTLTRSALEVAGLRTEGPIPQANVLRSLGAGSIRDRLRSEHALAVEEKRGADAVRALSRRQALGALLDTGGLGGLGVMTGFKDLPGASLL